MGRAAPELGCTYQRVYDHPSQPAQGYGDAVLQQGGGAGDTGGPCWGDER